MRFAASVTQAREKTRGFTLVELIVVIVVIGVLAAIAVPILTSQADKASDAALKSDLANAAKLLQVAEANGETLPSEMVAGQVVDLGTAGTFTASETLTVSGSGETLCVEGVSGSGNTYSANMAAGVRKYDCNGRVNGLSLAGRGLHVCALANGVIQCWGRNNYGQIDATSLQDGVKWRKIVAGELASCVITDTGGLQCWGYGAHSTSGPSLPSGSKWVDIGVSYWHACGLSDAGGVKCWGFHHDVPAELQFSGAASLASGGYHSCVLKSAGGLQCWGDNDFGQINVPANLQDGNVVSLSLGRQHTCALTKTNNIQCWGRNDEGQNNVPASSDGSDWTSISAGGYHTCGLTQSGVLQCWGQNTNKQTNVPSLAPGMVWNSVAAGQRHTCAVDTTESVHCWGANDNGQRNVPSSLQ